MVIKKIYFMEYDITYKSKIKMTVLKVRLHKVRIRIWKAYITFNKKFCIFGVAELQNAWDKEDLLLIGRRLKEIFVLLNMIYSRLRHICK